MDYVLNVASHWAC